MLPRDVVGDESAVRALQLASAAGFFGRRFANGLFRLLPVVAFRGRRAGRRGGGPRLKNERGEHRELGYPLGFLIVILGRQQLFTENTLTPILPLLRDKDRSTALNVLRLWVLVLASNILGVRAGRDEEQPAVQ